MIKLIQCVRRKPDMTVSEFRKHWEIYRDALNDLARSSGAVRATVNTELEVPQNTSLMTNRGTATPFDGVLEVWWKKGPDMLAFFNRPDIQARLKDIRLLQEEFMDLARSSFFFASEETLLEGKSARRRAA
jgi:hypothetical protein